MPVDPGTGQLIAYTDDQVAAWNLESRDIRDGAHPTEVFSPEGATSERSYFCDWEDRYDVIKWLVGEAAIWSDAGDDTVTRIPPQTHPDAEFADKWFCTKVVSITGHKPTGDAGGPAWSLPSPEYERAEIKCLFEYVSYAADKADDEVTTEQDRYTIAPGHPFNDIATSAEYVTMPGGSLNFLESGGVGPPYTAPHMTTIPYGIGFPMMREKFSFTWERVPFTGFQPSSTLRQRVQGTAANRTYIGSVNKTTFGNYPAGTLQLQGCEPRLMLDPTGTGWVWRIKYIFEYAPDGMHNLYFFDSRRDPTTNAPLTPSLSGWYQAGRGPTYQAPGAIADDTTLFHEREFADLWVVGDV